MSSGTRLTYVVNQTVLIRLTTWVLGILVKFHLEMKSLSTVALLAWHGVDNNDDDDDDDVTVFR